MQSFRQRRQIAARIKRWKGEQAAVALEQTAIALERLESDPERGSTESAGATTTATPPSPSAWDEFDRDLSPKNWSFARRLSATLLVTSISFAVQFASSVDSAAAEEIQAELHVGAVAESLATGLFLIGFGIGAPVAGPLSEIAGRNPVYIVSLAAFMLCTAGAGCAGTLSTQLVCRFFAGLFGSTPLVCAGGTVSDLWTPEEQIYIFPVYATGGFLGLAVGPAVGGAIAESSLVDWRWVEWSTLCLSGAVLLLVLLLQPETFAPELLRWKANALHALVDAQGDNAVTHDHEQELRLTRTLTAPQVGNKLATAFYRPVRLAISEPIIIMISLYLSVLYIVVFTFLPGYVFIFTDTYGFGPLSRGLCFLALGVGFLFAAALVVPIAWHARRHIRRHGELMPEARLHYAMCGAPAIPVSLLWMGWTARPSISPWSAIAASAMFGFGVLCVFFSSYQYIIHTYAQYAASGLVFITLTRYIVAGGMVVVGIPMYSNLGVAWTLTLVGCLSAVLVPIPFCLFWYGPTIRKWSKHVA